MSFKFTLDQFKKIAPGVKNPEDWFNALSKHLPEYEINTIERIAMFMAQCGHESGGFTIMQENLNYRAEGLAKVFPKYFRDADPNDYARKPEKIANRVYSSRMGNGNEASGDGWRFHGRGIIQITGKDNYTKCSHDVWKDDTLLTNPDILCTVDGAVISACWFWKMRNLNKPSDANDMTTATKLINGGTNGIDDRAARHASAMKVLKA